MYGMNFNAHAGSSVSSEARLSLWKLKTKNGRRSKVIT